MRKILEIIAIIILFISSTLIFWLGLSPKTFFKFFETYPVVTKTATKLGIITSHGPSFSTPSASESVINKNGEIIINGNTWYVEIANSDVTRTNGLSNRKALYSKKGMLFAFDKMANQSFWMKDMLIPIDMIFFDNNWKIVLIEADLQPNTFPKVFGNQVKSQYILEVNANEASLYNLKVGDQGIFVNK